jgi:Mn2+/Fe2+ NRAMP family transporter
MDRSRAANLLKVIGPGMLFAGAAIGVSHLVQSTRAGAMFGLGLVGVVMLANITKYPGLSFGSRYSNATGLSS